MKAHISTYETQSFNLGFLEGINEIVKTSSIKVIPKTELDELISEKTYLYIHALERNIILNAPKNEITYFNILLLRNKVAIQNKLITNLSNEIISKVEDAGYKTRNLNHHELYIVYL